MFPQRFELFRYKIYPENARWQLMETPSTLLLHIFRTCRCTWLAFILVTLLEVCWDRVERDGIVWAEIGRWQNINGWTMGKHKFLYSTSLKQPQKGSLDSMSAQSSLPFNSPVRPVLRPGLHVVTAMAARGLLHRECRAACAFLQHKHCWSSGVTDVSEDRGCLLWYLIHPV